jgi:hypothetical protein
VNHSHRERMKLVKVELSRAQVDTLVEAIDVLIQWERDGAASRADPLPTIRAQDANEVRDLLRAASFK